MRIAKVKVAQKNFKLLTPASEGGSISMYSSVVRGSASLSSDVDLLVEFNQPEVGPAGRFFGLLHGLEDVLG